MRLRFRSFLLSGVLLAASNAAASPGPLVPAAGLPAVPGSEPLRVRFYDPYRLLSPEAHSWLEKEVVRAFGASEIGLTFVGRGGPGVIPATLYPELPDRWDVAPEAIGVAIGVHGGPRSIFLSLGAAERALGLPLARRQAAPAAAQPARRRLPGSQSRRLGVALGRVLAHELVHTVAPECPHTANGLMAERLSRRMLTAPGIGFDALATRHLRRAAAGMVAPETG
ncbi:MAG: hypothetical protein OXU35_06370 [Acidobacteriota bacterium]|nr:hypothetical protein [Acidobacteriota bacterium]